ncbi:MAG: RHS repeat protein, partial [candidate division Zixibacteria bacterium]|nr:RHS repeat protein [candidate division Zixibacteria bacterium]
EQTTYDAAGNLLSVRDPRGNTTTYGYDVSRHLTQIADPLGHSITMTYSDIGAKISETGPLGHLTQFAYDDSAFNLPRLSSTTFADGNTRSKTYDVSGRTASEMDENGNITTFDYDAAGNLIQVTDALGHATTYAYDEVGNRISQTDANAHITTFEYDAVGRLIKRTLPMGMSETMTYDAVGNMASKTDFNGQTTTFTYDVMNRLVSKTLPNSDTLTWTYTPAGKVHTATDPSGTMTYTYDLRDRVTRIDQPDGTALIYTYDPAGNRTSVQSAAGTTAYTYDAANQLVSVTDPSGGITTSQYDLAGRLFKTIHANGTETLYSYDNRNRTTTVHHTGSGGSPTLARYDYLFDGVGNRTRMTESTGRVVDYAYDALNRLIQEDDGTTVVAYTYDGVGNRLNKGSETYTYDANNRLLTAGSTTFTYDSNGNLATKVDGTGITQYTYDAENRLIQQIAPLGAVTTFIYDMNGNRISRNEDGTITDFVVDPYDNSGYAQVLAEKNAAGTTVAGYAYGNGLLSMTQGGTSHYYHPDGIGSTRAMTDAGGSISDTYTYDAFGNLISSTGTTPNRYLFAGEQADPALGLYYLRARYMDPSTGRFISADPFPGSIFQPTTLHKYSYAYNNPVNFVDPSGQFGLASISISISISISLGAIGYSLFYKPAKEAWDKIKKLQEEIPAMPMNKNATVTDLLTITINSDPDELVYLGDGAVDEAYDAVGKMLTDAGKWVSVVHQMNSAYWLAHLPVVHNFPGNYLDCGFNHDVQGMYGLTLVTGLSAAKNFAPAANIIGVYLIYYTFLSLVGNTANDMAMNTIPAQPPGNPPTCNGP